MRLLAVGRGARSRPRGEYRPPSRIGRSRRRDLHPNRLDRDRHGPRRPAAERRRTLRRSRRTGARRPHEKCRRRCRQPDDRRYAGRRSVCARNHAVGRHGPRRHGAGRILRPAKPASARRERLRGPARRDGERPSVLRAPRRHARLRPLLLDPGPSQRIHRHPRPAQDEPFPLAPDRRSGLAHRNQEIP